MERSCTQPRFEPEAKGTSETTRVLSAKLEHAAASDLKQKLNYIASKLKF